VRVNPLQQLLLESLAIAVVAFAAGLAVAHCGVKALIAMVPRENQLPRMDAIRIDGFPRSSSKGKSDGRAAVRMTERAVFGTLFAAMY